eukprot:jgi/Phyca11/507931/fgenesh2_kg.PHYCAscaffold_31_\
MRVAEISSLLLLSWGASAGITAAKSWKSDPILDGSRKAAESPHTGDISGSTSSTGGKLGARCPRGKSTGSLSSPDENLLQAKESGESPSMEHLEMVRLRVCGCIVSVLSL